MKDIRPVEVPEGAFNYCKFTIPFLLWGALAFQCIEIVWIVFVILVFSIILKVKNAPLVFMYTHTINKIVPSKNIILDESAIRFAHIVGAVGAAIGIILFYLVSPLVGWIGIAVLALLKSSGAFGFCGAAKLYGCLNNPNGKCCRVGDKVKKNYPSC